MGIGALVYFIGCFLALLPVTRMVVTDFGTEPVSEADGAVWALGIALAFCICWFWPLALPGYVVYKIVKSWD